MEKKQQKERSLGHQNGRKNTARKNRGKYNTFLILFEFSKSGVITETKIIMLSHVVLNECRKNI